ncbi:MAG TPA: DUF2079 domain-containing protein [Pseudonocardiaceae bacterium]|nr:DUF2079 domain-containing protein [Pseudonocardiaceae bacterium]
MIDQSLFVRPVVRPAWPCLLAGLFFAGYTTWSLVLYREFQSTGYDLGIFEQAVRSYAAGHWPTADLKGPGYPVLGDHFSPILAVLAPFYLLYRGPQTLLVAQALLLAVSVVPVTRLAMSVVGRRSGVLIGIAYGMSWGLLHAARFDFHEVCFAVPLLAFAAEALALGRWRLAVCFAVPLVLVKEDLPWTVVAIGLYLVARRQWRLGWALAAFGAVVGVLVVLVVLPLVNPSGGYAYWSALDGSSLSLSHGLLVRLGTVLALLAPTLFLAVRSPLVWLALPTLGWRFVSGNPAYWGTDFHYNAVLMPIVFVAFVAALRGLRPMRFVAPVCLTITLALAVAPLSEGNGQPPWTVDQRATANAVLDLIPDGATVAAANRLAPHLTSRCRVFLFPMPPGVLPEWVVVAFPSTGWPLSTVDEQQRVNALPSLGYQLVVNSDNIMLYRR